MQSLKTLKETFERTPRLEGYGAPSAVLVPLMEVQGELCMLLTQRALHMKHQPGDFCFPGGHHEPGETPEQTALRETREEIGVPSCCIDLWGPSDVVISPFGAYIRPYVGYIHGFSLAQFRLNRDEVEKVLPVPLQFFFDTEPRLSIVPLEPKFPPDFPFHLIQGGESYQWGNASMKDWFYIYDHNVIWGITARIINNVKGILMGK